MRKSVLFLQTILVMIVLAGCTGSQDKDAITLEYERLVEQLPSSYSYDLTLPSASNDEFLVVYSVDGVMVMDYELVYQSPDVDEKIDVLITITYLEEVRQFHYEITQRGVDNRDLAAIFDVIFETIEAKIPSMITSNLTLPDIASFDVDILYQTNCGKIERGRIVYDFPSQDTNCKITTFVTFDGVTESHIIYTTRSSVDHLPRIPQVHITTVNNVDIEDISGTYRATLNLSGVENTPFDEINDAAMTINIRGNSTAWMPKKSYKIKFDEKQEFLAPYAEYDWVLLANLADQTLVRNYVAYWMADQLGMDVVPGYTFVDVYVNEEYQGNYMLTDQVEITNDRVDIEENSADIDTGYLLEFDRGITRDDAEFAAANVFYVGDIPFVLHSPKETDPTYSLAQKNFIDDYVNDVFDVLIAKEDYTALIDEQSWIDWFIVNEIFKNVDSGYSSVFMYKDKGGLLTMGPVWDFDLSSGNQGHLGDDLRIPEGWYTQIYYKNTFYYYLMQHPDFRDALQTRWNDVKEYAIYGALDQIFVAADSITYSRYQNFLLWDVIGKNEEWYTAPEVLVLDTYDEQVWFFHDYLETRIKWLDDAIN